MKTILKLRSRYRPGLGLICRRRAPASAPEQKIATVDLAKSLRKFYKTVRSTQALKHEASDMEKERKDMVDAEKKQEGEWQKLIDKAEDQAVSAENAPGAKKPPRKNYAKSKAPNRPSRNMTAPAPPVSGKRNASAVTTSSKKFAVFSMRTPRPAVTPWSWMFLAKAPTWRRWSFIRAASTI